MPFFTALAAIILFHTVFIWSARKLNGSEVRK